MTEISKFSFWKSFNDQIEFLDNPDDRLEFYEAIRIYAFYGEDYSFSNPMLEFNFIQVKTIIDADIKRKTGGAPGGNSNASKGNTCRKCCHYSKCRREKEALELCDNFKISNKTTQNNLQNNYKTNNVNVNDNVNDNENVNGISPFSLPSEKTENLPDITTAPMKDFGKQLYNKFVSAGLPHDKDLISFLMGTLKTGCELIHHNEETKKATSQEILQAVDNYITVLNDPKCFYNYKHSFISLCKSEQFFKFFPSNFVYDNWLNFKKTEEKKEPANTVHCESNYQWGNITYLDCVCPECSKQTIFYDELMQKYTCTSCKRLFDKNELKL